MSKVVPVPDHSVLQSPLMLSDRLLSLARSASEEGRRDAAVLLLAAAHAVLEPPGFRPRRALRRAA